MESVPPTPPIAHPVEFEPPPRHGSWWSATALVLVLFGSVGAGLWLFPQFITNWKARDARVEAEAQYLRRRAELKAEADHAQEQFDEKRVQFTSAGFRDIARRVAPSVVHVTNLKAAEEDDRPKKGFRDLFTDPLNGWKYHVTGAGSGVIVRPGVILTNYHVVRDADRLRITFASEQVYSFDAESSLLMDRGADLAVIRLPSDAPAEVEDELATAAEFADSDRDVQVGDWALAVGSPLGLKQTLTQGVISAKGRLLSSNSESVHDYVDLIQTDAAINPGNSGGPLYNERGRIVGINVAIASENGKHQGIGFAIPSNQVKKIVEQLLAKGEVARGFLGVMLREVDEAQAKQLKIEKGAVLIAAVQPGMAGHKGGLRVGDVIVGVDKTTLRIGSQAVRHFRQLIADIAPDTETSLKVLRDNNVCEIKVTIGKRPAAVP
jgi:serine protease Do